MLRVATNTSSFPSSLATPPLIHPRLHPRPPTVADRNTINKATTSPPFNLLDIMTPRKSQRSQPAKNELSLSSSLKRRRSTEAQMQPGLAQSRQRTDSEPGAETDSGPNPETSLQHSTRLEVSPEGTIQDDDLCPICHLLLYRPVTTKCKHTLCESCMAHWADVSVISQMTIVSLDEQPEMFAASEVEAKCPMCRTQTSASLNPTLEERLKSQYPQAYEERNEEEGSNEADGPGGSVQTLTLYIGNEHQLIRPEVGSSNMHNWTFFVKPSRTDIIEEIQILLHPTFRPSRIIRQRPPYEIHRRGWGYFTITAYVILKAGYSWVSEDAQNAPDGAKKGALPLEWTLDFSGFDGRGSMGRCRLKVKSDREWEDVEEEEDEDEQSRQRAVAQYARDGRWEPDED